ncbi:MAG TPA: hypothetical protein HPQ04_04240 [Rhodospirillaceae bacterium]|nr:hypothetical protein [Rhodospirillaceae bacterium]
MVEHLLRDFVPEVTELDLDFRHLQRVNVKFHGPRNRREGDIIWRLPTPQGDDIYLYLLLEFQSGSDWWMAVRTQVYQGLLWQHVIAETKLKSGDRLPPLLMLVLYNGERRWTAPTELADLILLPAASPLWHWQPRIRYHLLDMGAFPGDDLARRDSLAALLFRLEQRHPPEDLVGLIDQVVGWFRQHPGTADLRRLFTELVRQAMEGLGAALPVPADLMEIRPMLTTLGESWKQQWLAEGKAEGKADALQRLLDSRFGPVTETARSLIAAADLDRLDHLFDRALTATTLDAVFDESKTH